MRIKNIHVNVWIGALCIVLSIVFFMMAGQFRDPDAAIWPKAVLTGIIILSAMLVIHGFKLTGEHADPGIILRSQLKGSMISLACVVIYAVLMNYTGYFVSSAVFLPFGMFALGQRNWKTILGVTVGLELFVYVLFVLQLQLRMP